MLISVAAILISAVVADATMRVRQLRRLRRMAARERIGAAAHRIYLASSQARLIPLSDVLENSKMLFLTASSSFSGRPLDTLSSP